MSAPRSGNQSGAPVQTLADCRSRVRVERSRRHCQRIRRAVTPRSPRRGFRLHAAAAAELDRCGGGGSRIRQNSGPPKLLEFWRIRLREGYHHEVVAGAPHLAGTFHSSTVVSIPPEASSLPSAENASALTRPCAPFSSPAAFPV